MGLFTETSTNSDSYWRSIILFGRNVASYKFALASSLLELASKEAEFVRMEELAVPFATRIVEHLKISDKQGTSGGSRFLDYCRQYNRGEISFDKLVDRTVELEFNNVIDAFHVVNQGGVPVRFYLDERKGGTVKGIRVTDELLKLKESFQFQNFGFENEARGWLVEKAWELGISRQLLQVSYEAEDENLFVEVSGTGRKEGLELLLAGML